MMELCESRSRVILIIIIIIKQNVIYLYVYELGRVEWTSISPNQCIELIIHFDFDPTQIENQPI